MFIRSVILLCIKALKNLHLKKKKNSYVNVYLNRDTVFDNFISKLINNL